MSFANKFNKTNFGIDTKDFKYVKLSELYADGGKDRVHNINGLFIHNSQLGASPVVIDATNKRLVNLPAHLTATVSEILADGEAVDTIKANKVGYTIYEYESHGKKCYSIKFIDI